MTDMYRVTTKFTGPQINGGGIQQFYFDLGGGTAVQAAAAVKTFWAGFSGFLQTGNSIEVQAGVEQVVDTDGRIILIYATTGQTTATTGGSEPLSPATQGLIQWRTGVYSDSREIRGRTFIPAMMESLNTSGAPASSLVTAVNTLAAALIADANSILVTYRRERLARPQVGVPGDPWFLRQQAHRDGEFAPVTTGALWSKWATLRSRRD
jgi:Flp pilus assembly protein TadG